MWEDFNKKNQKEQLSPIHKVPHKCKNSLLKISWLMMVEYEWFSYELIQYVSSDCIVLYLYAHIDYKDTWFSHELTQYVSLDFPFGKLKWFNVNLQISLCSKFFMALNTMISDFLMDWFNMSIQMSLLFSFIFTEITSVLDIFMDWFIMSLQNSLCCSFIFTQIT